MSAVVKHFMVQRKKTVVGTSDHKILLIDVVKFVTSFTALRLFVITFPVILDRFKIHQV